MTTTIHITGNSDHPHNMIQQLTPLLENMINPMILYHGPDESPTLRHIKNYGRINKIGIIHADENPTRNIVELAASEYMIAINPDHVAHSILDYRNEDPNKANKTAVIFTTHETRPQEETHPRIIPTGKRAGKRSRRRRGAQR